MDVSLKYYTKFCRFIHKLNIPKLKLRDINDRYKYLYKKLYNIEETDVNKASLIILLTSFFPILFFIQIIFNLNFFITIFCSFILALSISYKFNLYLYNRLKKAESQINMLLYFIKINYSLIQKTLDPTSDLCLFFIRLINTMKIPILDEFKSILRDIHEGKTPEKLLIDLITPSEDLDNYIQELLVKNFNYSSDHKKLEENSIEKNFKIYLKDIEVKISIIFFVGLFFPIGFSFFVIFQNIQMISLLFFIPIYFFFLNFLYRKFMKADLFLIILYKEYSKKEARKLEEFLILIKGFAINLNFNISPEKAFINSYEQNRKFFVVLKESLDYYVSQMINLSESFTEILNNFSSDLHSVNYSLILDSINYIIEQNAHLASYKIVELLKIIYKHKKLNNKLEIIIKGEKFKVLLFLFLLPLLLGAIGGTIPLFYIASKNFELYIYSNPGNNLLSYIDFMDLIIIFSTLMASNSFSTYFFLRVAQIKKIKYVILISNILFTVVFMMTLINLLNFIFL